VLGPVQPASTLGEVPAQDDKTLVAFQLICKLGEQPSGVIKGVVRIVYDKCAALIGPHARSARRVE
jgi:hypothetical protein